MSAEKASSFGEIQGKMREVEKSQESRLGKEAEGIFDEEAFIKKIQVKQKELTKILNDVQLSKEKQQQILKSPEMKKLIGNLQQMKGLQSDRESLKKMGEGITHQLFILFDKYAKPPVAKKETNDKQESPLIVSAKNLLNTTKGMEFVGKVPVTVEQINTLYAKVLKHQNTAKSALSVWNDRKTIPVKNGLSASEDPRMNEATQLMEAYKILQTLRPEKGLYEGMKYMQREYPKIWLQQKITAYRKELARLISIPGVKEKDILTVGKQISAYASELRSFQSNPKVLPYSYVKVFPEVKNKLYSDDIQSLGDIMKNIPQGVLLGLKDTAVFTYEAITTLSVDLVKLPSVIGYATAHYHGDTNAVLKEIASDNAYGKMVKGIVDISKYISQDPKQAYSQMKTLIAGAPEHFGKWWDVLTPEEKGESIGKLISMIIPTGTALGITPKIANLVKETAVLRKTMDVLHTSFYLKGVPKKFEAKAFSKMMQAEIKIVGKNYIEKNVYAELRKIHPKGYSKFFEQKTGLLNADFINSKEGREILKKADFKFMGMLDVGGVGTENAVLGSAMANKRFDYIKTLADDASKRGVLICRTGGDEYVVFSHQDTVFKQVQSKMDTYQKTLNPTLVKKAHEAEHYKSESKKQLQVIEENIVPKIDSELVQKDYAGAQKKFFDEIAAYLKKDEVVDVASFQKAFPEKKFTAEELKEITNLQENALKVAQDLAKEIHADPAATQKMQETMQRLSVYIFLKKKASVAPKSNFGVMYTVYDKFETSHLETILARLEDGISKRKKLTQKQKKSYENLAGTRFEKWFGGLKKNIPAIKVKTPREKITYTDTGSLTPKSTFKEEVLKKLNKNDGLIIHDRSDLEKPLKSLLPENGKDVLAIGWESNIGSYNNMTKFTSGSGTAIANDLITLARYSAFESAKVLEKQGIHVDFHIINEGGTFALYALPKKGAEISHAKMEKILQDAANYAQKEQKGFIEDLIKSERDANKALADKNMSVFSKSFAKMSVNQNSATAMDKFQRITPVRNLSATPEDTLKNVLFNYKQ